VIDMLVDGHPEGAQALAANLLDSMLRETLDKQSARQVTDQSERLSIDALPLQASMVFGGIWFSHTEFRSSRGNATPRGFSRHGNVPSNLGYRTVGALSATGRTAESVLCQAKMQRRPDVPPSPMAGRYSFNAC
jgi:hypothetical protein